MHSIAQMPCIRSHCTSEWHYQANYQPCMRSQTHDPVDPCSVCTSESPCNQPCIAHEQAHGSVLVVSQVKGKTVHKLHLDKYACITGGSGQSGAECHSRAVLMMSLCPWTPLAKLLTGLPTITVLAVMSRLELGRCRLPTHECHAKSNSCSKQQSRPLSCCSTHWTYTLHAQDCLAGEF